MLNHRAGVLEYVLIALILFVGAYEILTLVQPTTDLMNADAEMVISKCGAN